MFPNDSRADETSISVQMGFTRSRPLHKTTQSPTQSGVVEECTKFKEEEMRHSLWLVVVVVQSSAAATVPSDAHGLAVGSEQVAAPAVDAPTPVVHMTENISS